MDFAARYDPDDLRERRVERAREAMGDAGLDALLVLKDENVRYLTGLRAQLIAGKTHAPERLPPARRGPARSCSPRAASSAGAGAMPWIEEFHPIPIMEAAG